MTPLTRLRSKLDDSPSDMMVEHYFQRASAGGLIILDAAAVSRAGVGYLSAPGVYAVMLGRAAIIPYQRCNPSQSSGIGISNARVAKSMVTNVVMSAAEK